MNKLMCAAMAVALVALGGMAASVPEPGELRLLPYSRVQTNTPNDRIYFDYRMNVDFRTVQGVQFDFRCSDFSNFTGFSIYFQSGNGWYSASFTPEKEAEWHRIEVPRRLVTHTEGSPAGWREISCVRIGGWCAGTKRGDIEVANLAFMGGKVRALVISGDSCGARHTNERNGYSQYAGALSGAFEQIGYPSAVVSDYDVEPAMLDGVELLALPYNSSLTTNAVQTLEAHVARGGKLFVCYSLPSDVCRLLGLKNGGFNQPAKEGRVITGFRRVGDGLPGQPEFAEQASWAFLEPKIQGEGRVLATWALKGDAQCEKPALVETKNGIFMGHVWLGSTPNAYAMLRAVVEELAPGAKPLFAAAAAVNAARAKAMLDYVKSVPPKADAFRGVWCHSAWGLGGDHDWDSSIRFLKENGFTDIIANLAWGGMAFYQSKVLPVSGMCAEHGDALEQSLAACRKYGIKLHVWKVCWRMNSSCSAEYRAAMKAAERTQVRFDGKDDLNWFCPTHPENLRAEVETMCELAERGVDGVHFDYIRYPDRNGCFCKRCRSLFEKRLGRSVANWPDDVRKDKELAAAWTRFRSDNITAAVRGVAERLHGKFPTRISAAVFRDAENDPSHVGQDWGRWCREGWLDFVCPMDYTPSAAQHRAIVKRQLPYAGQAKLYPGVGLSCWARDGRDAQRLAEQIAGLRALGLEGFTVFNFDRRAEDSFPIIHLGPTAALTPGASTK